MMSAFFHFQHTSNRLFNNCIKLYTKKTTLKKHSLIRANSELQHQDTESAIKNKLKVSLTELKGFKFVMTFLLKFKKEAFIRSQRL